MTLTPHRPARYAAEETPVRLPADLEEALAAAGRLEAWRALDPRDRRHIVDLINEADGVARRDRVEITVDYVLAAES